MANRHSFLWRSGPAPLWNDENRAGRRERNHFMKAKRLFFSLSVALALLFLPALSFADGGSSGGGSQEAPGMAAVGGPDMPGAGGVVIILIGAIPIGAGAAVTGAAGVAVTGGAGAAVTGGAVTHGVGVAVTGTNRIWLTNHTKWRMQTALNNASEAFKAQGRSRCGRLSAGD
jgi:hypothetical protein